MKRWLSLLLAALMALSLTACGDASLGVIGGADGPTSIVITDGDSTITWEESQAASPYYQETDQWEQEAPDDGEVPEDEGDWNRDNWTEKTPDDQPSDVPDELGCYDSKEDVALYLHLYGHLPPNYMTKKAAQKLGWEGGSLEDYAPGMCIGGSRFGNYEGLLPEAEGREYTECDIDTIGKSSRGAKRIVFSNDGLIFYTEDHYESFELLYGDYDAGDD